MWYVIQTMVGKEEEVVTLIEKMIPRTMYTKCFVPKYENVWKKQGMSNISIEQLFRGYVFIEAERADDLFYELKNVPQLSKLLTDGNIDEGYSFIPIYEDEEQFLRDILQDDPEDVVRLSYVKRNARKWLEWAIGPLANYMDKITDVDYKHRRVFVELDLFGRHHRIKFGIKTDEDFIKEGKPLPKPPKKDGGDMAEELYIEPGMYIRDLTGVYEGYYPVKKFNNKKQIVVVDVEMFGMPVEVELDAAKVEVFEEMPEDMEEN